MLPFNNKLKQQILNEKPSEQQKEVIFTKEKEFLLRASPGSGKTWTSSRRFIWRAANWEFKSGGIALLSFTNTAINEFRDTTIRAGWGDLLSDPNFIGTLDSFVERYIINPFGHLYTTKKQRPKLYLHPRHSDKNNPNLKLWFQGNRRGHYINAWEIDPIYENGNQYFYKNSLLNATNAFEKVDNFFKLGYYTHSQRGLFALKLLENSHITRILVRRFPEIIIDEAQDTNPFLVLILKELHDNGAQITLIGDPDQCIYEFNNTDPKLLDTLKVEWNLTEFPLTRSYRCHNLISSSARSIIGSSRLEGTGLPEIPYFDCYIVCETSENYTDSLSVFNCFLQNVVPTGTSAVLCRGRDDIDKAKGVSNYTSLQGTTKKIAQAIFYRDILKDYKKSYQTITQVVKELLPNEGSRFDRMEESPEDEDAISFRIALWKFSKSKEYLPPLNTTGDEWIDKVKTGFTSFFQNVGINNIPSLGNTIRRSGIDSDKIKKPLYQPHLQMDLRFETVHQVKGETIDNVLILGSDSYFDDVIKHMDTEERRIAYVAMTRARNVLVVGLPESHYTKYLDKWKSWGFNPDIKKLISSE